MMLAALRASATTSTGIDAEATGSEAVEAVGTSETSEVEFSVAGTSGCFALTTVSWKKC